MSLGDILSRAEHVFAGARQNIAKKSPEIDINAVVARQEIQQIISQYTKLQTQVKKLLNITISGIEEKTSNENEPNNCCLYSKTLSCLYASVAGVKTPKDLPDATPETTGKEYHKLFGHGYIAKGLYTAIKKSCEAARAEQK